MKMVSFEFTIVNLLLSFFHVGSVSAANRGQVVISGGSRGGSSSSSSSSKGVTWETPLNFAKLYPTLDKDTSTKCRQVWERQQTSPCTLRIVSRGWDESHVVGWRLHWDLQRYIPQMCSGSCEADLKSFEYKLERDCGKEGGRFDLTSYSGHINTTYLEPTAYQMVHQLRERQNHFCAKPPTTDPLALMIRERNQQFHPEYCMVQNYERWTVLHGLSPLGKPGNVDWDENIKSFESETKSPTMRMGGTSTSRIGSGKWTKTIQKKEPKRMIGPNKGQTDCDWCIRDWFKRSLAAAETEEQKERIEKAMSRCKQL